MVALSEPDDVQGLLSTCFSGINMTTCTYDDEASASDDLSGIFADFSWGSVFSGEAAYCLTCCNNRRLDFSSGELIALQCDLSNPLATKSGKGIDSIKLNETDWEFRFARRSTVDDRAITRCALQRTNYSNMVSGYELTIYAQEYNNVVAFWRGVTGCNAVAIEVAPEAITNDFSERIILQVNAANARTETIKVIFFVWALLGATHGMTFR
ncbi:Hypothetical Protein FCC1311_032312 [Hondaea fermentalgiana]|uniref:Uncharacterized protein n=1 Tax=Hondaea fermentalgiana TaxID=2315210 RepID=A0A2R5GBC6_9STRA|nr:Hypothetical Protein FCC1311_032312 [Hondaea fermentalgiana]|eukprot:GBG27008.1 Hypothetical Protein FCC1311_032312 [Hondaea fermentalgiana]